MTEAPLPMNFNINLKPNKNNEYEINISKNSNLFNITITSKNSLLCNKYYIKNFTLEELQKNRFLQIARNIDEIFILFEEIELKESLIIENSNEILLKIPTKNKLVPYIIFNIPQKERDFKNCINDLESLISKSNDSFNVNYCILLKEIAERHENEINLLKKEIEDIKNIINKKNIFPSSKIIDNKQWEIIKDWINPNEKINFNLIFIKSRDGSNVSDFHKFCDNKGKILLLIETNNNFKFGGYTPLNFDSSGFGKNDNNSFLFSITNNQKYTKKNKNNSIHCRENYIAFGYDSYDLYFSNQLNSGNLQSNNSTSYLNDLSINGGNSKFITKEIEVYQVQF